MEREPARRDRHLDERGARAARRLGGLDPAGTTSIPAAMNAPVLADFSYDPFDPAVMADPLSYYRILRDQRPVYYMQKWDTFALSRFSDIWDVLEINDGTFVATEGTLPATTVLARRNDGPLPDPPLPPTAFTH